MIGNRIKKLRAQKHMTQKELSEQIGVTTSMIGMYETNDRKPSYNTLTKIANYFKVSTDYLLGNTKDPQEHIITDDELPDVIRPFLKKDSRMVATIEPSEDDLEYMRDIQDPYAKTRALEETFKSMNAYDFPALSEIISHLPSYKKGQPISVYELFDIVGKDQNAMLKLLASEKKDPIIVQPKDENHELLNDPQIKLIARASQKLSPEKRDLILRLAESMIDE